MKVINYGSLNIDHVYRVPHLVRPGETLTSLSYNRFPGGKGLNQSVAMARAGVPVIHAGKIGEDGRFLAEMLAGEGVDTTFLQVNREPTGHAIIQVSAEGENSIVLFGGANKKIQPSETERIISEASRGDFLLLQNEISSLREIIEKASRKDLYILFNPAPMTKDVLSFPLHKIGTFIVNRLEGEQLSGEKKPKAIVESLQKQWPQARICLTLGQEGVLYRDRTTEVDVSAFNVKTVDTTAAGDTFVGYFTAGLAKGLEIRRNLTLAAAAAAICVTREGAAPSIPRLEEVEGFLS